MKRIRLLFAISLIVCGQVVSAQTRSDLTAKYGEPVQAYSVSEHIWMTPEYSGDGQVCQLKFYPKRIGAADINFLSDSLPFQELVSVLNQVVPVNARGSKKGSFGVTATGGGAAWTTYPYDIVTFIFVAPMRLNPTEKSRPYVIAEQKFPSDNTPKVTTIIQDDFVDSQTSGAEVVTIRWNNRRCSAH